MRNASNQAQDPSDAPAARPPHVPMHARPQHDGQKVRDDDDARPGPRPRVWWHRVLSFPHRAPPPHRVEAFLFHAVKRAQREGILVTQRRGGEKLPS